MACEPLNGVTLSPEGEKTLKTISKKIELGNALQPVLVGGTLVAALVSDKAIPVIFNVNATDWSMLAQAVKASNVITKRAVRTEIEMMILKTSGKENTFWKSLYECY